jgi:hypothetical protein
MFYRNRIDDVEFNESKFNCFLFFNPLAKNIKKSGQLIIELKVYLEPDNTVATVGPFSNNDNRSFKQGVWPDPMLQTFKKIYQKTGQSYWDKKFVLINNSYTAFDLFFGREKNGKLVYKTSLEVPPLITGPTMVDGVLTNPEENNYRLQHNFILSNDSTSGIVVIRPEVECRFQLKLVNTAGEAHKTIRVAYFTHFKEARGGWHQIKQFSPTYFRSDSSNYSQSDILLGTNFFHGIPLKQNTHIHEIGHAIGLKHSGEAMREPQCMAKIAANDRYAEVCYGSRFISAANVMGKGNAMLPMNADPWKHAIKLMTKSDIWRVKLL